jgi:hypothetical protein
MRAGYRTADEMDSILHAWAEEQLQDDEDDEEDADETDPVERYFDCGDDMH